ncbi:VPLPA-CTERM-specific exosortase XrtD [Rhodobacteraceae bacterium NNCM2]|nr:VPLPA-CTERM-specific exosortase XrtD [Coraliihabitans acroporae]
MAKVVETGRLRCHRAPRERTGTGDRRVSVSIDSNDRTGFGLHRIWPGALWLGLAALAAIVFFHQGMLDLWQAWQTPEYSHGPLIPLISGYLFLRQMKGVPPSTVPVTDRWPGVLVLIAALLLGLFGNVTQIQKLIAVALIIWVGGMILVSFGWRRGHQFWPPVLHLCFMLPLPFFLYWKTSIFLQGVSSELGVTVIRMMEIPVFLDGNIIDLGIYKLHVAEACSGLRYMFPIMSFTYIFAVLYQGSVWHKGILLFAAVPIAILMNSLRIGIIGVLVDSYGIEQAEGFLHVFEGWVIFLLCILAMLALSRLLMVLSGDKRSFADVLDVDTTGLGGQLARIGDIRPSRAMLGMSAVFLAAGLAWSPLTTPEPEEIRRDPFLLFPSELGEWQSLGRQTLPPEIAGVLAADDYLVTNYVSPNHAAPVDFFIAWYRDQNKGGIHSPEVCIPAGGWEMSEITQAEIPVEIAGRAGGPLMIPVNRAIIQKGLSRQLVYYWFDQAGRRLTSDYAAKAWLLVDALRTGRTDGALVRLVTPIGEGEPIERAEGRLQSMLSAAMPVLPGYIATDLNE